MATSIFLGLPPPNIANWIREHSQPVIVTTPTLISYTDDTQDSYNWTGPLTEQMLRNVASDHDIDYDQWKQNVYAIDIGNGITEIGERALSEYDSLASIRISNTVTAIGEYAFAYSRGFSWITIPSSVISIGDQAFTMMEFIEGLTFEGKTVADVKAMANFPWEINDHSPMPTIECSDGNITFNE